ncbi:MAG: hypothetical protein H0W09_07640 [Solirubrobacterales bacterium]|nr:hypothetical protein [Solirubrobacterales bacterium]
MSGLLPLAHLGSDHWYAFALYLAPVAIVVIAILSSAIRQRREAAEAERGRRPSPPEA